MALPADVNLGVPVATLSVEAIEVDVHDCLARTENPRVGS